MNGCTRLCDEPSQGTGVAVSDSPANLYRTGSQLLPSGTSHLYQQTSSISHSDYVTGASKTQTALLQSSYRVAGFLSWYSG